MNAKDLKKHLACLTLAGLMVGSTGAAFGASGWGSGTQGAGSAQSALSPEDQNLMETLRAKKEAGTITASEKKKLDALMKKSGQPGKPAPSGWGGAPKQ